MAGIAVAPLIQRDVTIPEVGVPYDFSAVAGEEPSVSGDAGRQGAIEDVNPHRDASDEVHGCHAAVIDDGRARAEGQKEIDDGPLPVGPGAPSAVAAAVPKKLRRDIFLSSCWISFFWSFILVLLNK